MRGAVAQTSGKQSVLVSIKRLSLDTALEAARAGFGAISEDLELGS